MDAYASPVDIETAWRPLSSEEKVRSRALIEQCSKLIDQRWPSVPARLAGGTLDPLALKAIVIELVVDRLKTDHLPLGVTSFTDTEGPFSTTVRFDGRTGPGAFAISDWMLSLLDDAPAVSRPKAGMWWMA